VARAGSDGRTAPRRGRSTPQAERGRLEDRGAHDAYLERHGIPQDEINQNSHYQTKGVKPVADLYWDDRAALRRDADARPAREPGGAG